MWRGALIGCGFFAPNQLHAWQSIPQVCLAALCDRDLSKARAMGAAFGVDHVYDDAAEMLRRERVDFVDIVTTVESHRELVTVGARHSKLVICQKPFAQTLADADAMIAECAAARVPLLVHENFRWQRPFIELAARVRAGRVGRPRFLRLTFRHAHDIYSAQPYLAQVARLAIMDIGLHLFDLVRLLMGEVHNVHCRTQKLNPAVQGEDCFVASLQHEDAISIVECSFFSRQYPDRFPQTLALIEGTEGTLELAADYRLRACHDGRVEDICVEPPVPSWGSKPWHVVQDSVINFQRHALDVLDGRHTPQPSGAHNRDTLKLVVAAYESAACGRSIDVF